MRVVQIGQVGRRVSSVGSGGIADSASVLGWLVSGWVTEAFGASSSADGGCDDWGSESSVNKVGDAAARAAVLVASIGRGGSEREGRGGKQGHGAGGHVHSLSQSLA